MFKKYVIFVMYKGNGSIQLLENHMHMRKHFERDSYN